MAASSVSVKCYNSTLPYTDGLRCCPSGSFCLSTLCQSYDGSNTFSQQPCNSPNALFPYDSASDQPSSSWSIVIVWPVVIFVIFALTSIGLWWWHRRRALRAARSRPRNWHPSARTTEDDAELPSYDQHYRSAKPWWIQNTSNDVVCEDMPPEYLEPPKYPDAIHEGDRRRVCLETGDLEDEIRPIHL